MKNLLGIVCLVVTFSLGTCISLVLDSPAEARPPMNQFVPQVVQWTNTLTTKPNSKILYAANEFIYRSYQRGNWQLFDRVWLFAQDNQTNADYGLINTSTIIQTSITRVNTPVWSATLGYSGNGTTSYINTNFIPSGNGVNWVQGAAAVAIYTYTQLPAGSNLDFGSSDGTRGNMIGSRFTGDITYIGLNYTALLAPTGYTVTTGVVDGHRSTTQIMTGYKNGTAIGTTTNNANATLVGRTSYLGAWNSAGTAGNFSKQWYPMLVLGGNFDAAGLYIDMQVIAIRLGFDR